MPQTVFLGADDRVLLPQTYAPASKHAISHVFRAKPLFVVVAQTMKSRTYWIHFALLAAVQLSLVMVGVVLLFQWFESGNTDAMRSATLASTRAMSGQIVTALKSQRIPDRYRRELTKCEFADGGFACVINPKSGHTLYHHGEQAAYVETAGSLAFTPALQASSRPTTIVAALRNPETGDSVSGSLTADGDTWWGTARIVPDQNAIVFVAQSKASVMELDNGWADRARTTALAIAALISMFAIAAPAIGLFRYDNNLRNHNDNLERQATHNERELVRTRNAVIFGLAKLAESRDNDTGEHLDRIRRYVEILSADLANQFPHIDEEFTRNLSLASSLHDIGKVGIPDSILLKPGRLTPEERSVMQIHTVIGGECLDAIGARLGDNPFMHMARQIAYYHHERWDGAGYPHQLSGEEIPLVARIVAVADVYDALTSKRPYKRAMSHLESRGIILAGSGSQFDPEVIAAFMRHEHEFEEISRKQQSVSDAEATSRFVRLHELAAAGAEETA